MVEASPSRDRASLDYPTTQIPMNGSSTAGARKHMANHVVGNTKNNARSKSNGVTIRAKNESDRMLLVAGTEGNIAYLESVKASDGPDRLRNVVCSSGCHLLHWAAGSDRADVLEYLLWPLEDDGSCHQNTENNSANEQSEAIGPIFRNTKTHRAVDLPVTKCKKSWGRTPLHYACRNGCLAAVRWLVENGRASIGLQAKQGVTPFQLAVWQNRFEICRFLVQHGHDAGTDFNHFGCGAVHWLGIAPESRANYLKPKADMNGLDSNHEDGSQYNDGRDLLPLAKWLASLPGIDFGARQRQNHTAMHKAAWGGHLALIEYLHVEMDMWDEVVDDAGNYAASLADMANTPKHAEIAVYLRHHCSRKRAFSLRILGLPSHETDLEIVRRAYLRRAKELHPDRLMGKGTTRMKQKSSNDLNKVQNHTETTPLNQSSKISPENDLSISFDELRKAYVHLTEERGVGDQSNPAHSLNLMLQFVNSNRNHSPNEVQKSEIKTQAADDESDDSFFKARLIAVLLEYGDKGIDLSNVKKKWKQVWPKVPFPPQIQMEQPRPRYREKDIGSRPNQQSSPRKISMADFLMQRAGDVIRFQRHGERNRRVLVLLKDRNLTKEQVLRSGSAVGTSEESV